jgi:hypothetical protein
MKVHQIAQGSVEWSLLRSGKVCASEFDSLVSPLGKVRTGDGPRSYLHKKLAEKWTGGPLPSLNVWDFDQGHFLEEYARPAFALETGLIAETCGFIESDDGRAGCSPDGLIASENTGIEIKCPHIETHIGYLLAGILPSDYVLQVQASLYITGFKKWHFYSFRRKMPSLHLIIEPDETIQKAITTALAEFKARFDEGYKRLEEINGGPPKRNATFQPKPPKTDPNGDITP